MPEARPVKPDPPLPDKNYTISEASAMIGVQPHLLRQWERRFSDLRPKRSSANRRMYTLKDIENLRRIKTLLYHEGMTSTGAQRRMRIETKTGGIVANRQAVLDLSDKIAEEARAIIRLFDDGVASTKGAADS